MSVNKIILIGRLGADPEMRYMPTGEAVCVFSIATTEEWKDRTGAKQERTDWHRVEFIGRIAEVCGQYLHKGKEVYVEGRMQYDRWTDKEGIERTVAKVRGAEMRLLGGSRRNEDAAPSERKTTAAAQPASAQPMSASPTASGASPSARPRTLDDFDQDVPF